MSNAIQPNLGIVYLLKNGEVKDPVGLNNFNAVSNVNMLLVHVEDGDGTNFCSINYSPNKITAWSSHDFPLFFRGMVDKTINGESSPRRFAQYSTFVPPQIASMNINGTAPMSVGVTVKQNAGTRLLGAFIDLITLNNQYPPNGTLRDENAVAYILDDPNLGYYMVEYDINLGTYSWKLNTDGRYLGEVFIRGYNMFNIGIQRSGQNPKPMGEISDLQIKMLWQETSSIRNDMSILDAEVVKTISKIDTESIEIELNRIGNDVNIKADLKISQDINNVVELRPDGIYVLSGGGSGTVASVLEIQPDENGNVQFNINDIPLSNTKLDKVTTVTTYPKVYIKEADGTQGTRDFSVTALGSSIPQRNALGQLEGVLATTETQLVIKSQMDGAVATKLNTSTLENIVYVNDFDGVPTVVEYTAVNDYDGTFPIRDDDGNFAVGNPTQPKHTVNKQTLEGYTFDGGDL